MFSRFKSLSLDRKPAPRSGPSALCPLPSAPCLGTPISITDLQSSQWVRDLLALVKAEGQPQGQVSAATMLILEVFRKTPDAFRKPPSPQNKDLLASFSSSHCPEVLASCPGACRGQAPFCSWALQQRQGPVLSPPPPSQSPHLSLPPEPYPPAGFPEGLRDLSWCGDHVLYSHNHRARQAHGWRQVALHYIN